MYKADTRSGTSQDTVVTYDARSGTPLMALSYAHDDELTVSR